MGATSRLRRAVKTHNWLRCLEGCLVIRDELRALTLMAIWSLVMFGPFTIELRRHRVLWRVRLSMAIWWDDQIWHRAVQGRSVNYHVTFGLCTFDNVGFYCCLLFVVLFSLYCFCFSNYYCEFVFPWQHHKSKPNYFSDITYDILTHWSDDIIGFDECSVTEDQRDLWCHDDVTGVRRKTARAVMCIHSTLFTPEL